MSNFPNFERQSPAHKHVSDLVDFIDQLGVQDVLAVKRIWEGVWEHQTYTPQEVFSLLGVDGLKLLLYGAAQVQCVLATCAANGVDPDTVLPSKYRTAPLPYIINADHSITITAPEGES